MENTITAVTCHIEENNKNHTVTVRFAHAIPDDDSLPVVQVGATEKDHANTFARLFQLIEEAGNEKVDITIKEDLGVKFFSLFREKELIGCNVREIKQALLLKAAA